MPHLPGDCAVAGQAVTEMTIEHCLKRAHRAGAIDQAQLVSALESLGSLERFVELCDQRACDHNDGLFNQECRACVAHDLMDEFRR